ncbi:MAG: SDR family NAD(P)-dependent oxidoreductase [Anaerolineales bacterium]|nr:SDR family NAD(P)-dependent oxidoreductase [Anaerolineales bacterium]
MRALSGKNAIITGGGSGIGRGIALALVRRGANVMLAGRRPDALAAVAAEIDALNGRAVALAVDLREVTACEQLIDATRTMLGGIDILVNNAGVLAAGRLDEHAVDDIHAVVTLNLTAPISLTRLAWPELMAAGRLMVVSAMSKAPLPYASLYAATKAGLAAFGASLWYEGAPVGVQVLTAFPPGTATELTAPLAAGRRFYRLANPLVVGERIVSALEAGRTEVAWGPVSRRSRGCIELHLTPRAVSWLRCVGSSAKPTESGPSSEHAARG